MARGKGAHLRVYNDQAIARLRGHLEGFSEAELDRAAMRARVTMIRRTQPIVSRDVRERFGVKARALSGKFQVREGRSRGGAPFLGVWGSARRIPLIDFKGRHSRRQPGATAEVSIGRRKTYNSAFIATVQGRKSIRVRQVEDQASGKRHGRGPLRMLRGPSPLEMMLGQDMRHGPELAGKILDVFQPELRRQIELLRRGRRKG